jgi:hypothetical protein
MGRRRKKVEHGWKRVYWKLPDGRVRTGLRKVKCWAGRGKWKRSARDNRKSAKKLVGKVSRWYRITPQDDFMQKAVRKRITNEILRELGL